MSRPPTAADWAVLELRPGATADEVRTAYRRLAKVHHPDRNPGDRQALETFRRLTESYEALRTWAPAGASSPLSAARAARSARRHPSTRRGSAASGSARVADLEVGASLWLDAAALLVAPDRTAALRPDATGEPFPSADHVIRVERRTEGLHVFIPPQPPARWALDGRAETEGLAVVALWVGERQDGPEGSASAVRVPLRLIGDTVGEMAPGDRGWTSASALVTDGEGGWSLVAAEPVNREPHRATRLRILRDDDGFRVHSELPASAFPSSAARDGEARVQVVAAILAGIQYPAPPG